MTGDGFLLVDKEGGWTSHDVVAKLRGALGIRKIGHAGTLDPMATGLLVIGVGRATRLLRFVQDRQKVYLATAMFGVATDSLDAEGAVLSARPHGGGRVRGPYRDGTFCRKHSPGPADGVGTPGRRQTAL